MTSTINQNETKLFLKDSLTFQENKTLVFFHATRFNGDIKEFKLDKNGCAYFSSSKEVALTFTDFRYRRNLKYRGYEEFVYEVYLNTKKTFNPKDIKVLKTFERYFKENLSFIVLKFMHLQLLENYGEELGGNIFNFLRKGFNQNIFEEIKVDSRVLEECLLLYYSYHRRGEEFAFKKLYEILTSNNSWIIFEKVFPEFIAHLKKLDYDSFMTFENINDEFNFNIAVFSSKQIKILKKQEN